MKSGEPSSVLCPVCNHEHDADSLKEANAKGAVFQARIMEDPRVKGLVGALEEAVAVLNQVGARHPEYHGTKGSISTVGAAYLRGVGALQEVKGGRL